MRACMNKFRMGTSVCNGFPPVTTLPCPIDLGIRYESSMTRLERMADFTTSASVA
jgi:hypothetical protein